MDSQLYIVINDRHDVGQQISKYLAGKGNTVVYLTDNEQDGFTIAAEEPRVRFRQCSPNCRRTIADEFQWTASCVAPINGIVVFVQQARIEALSMPLDAEYFASVLRKLENLLPHRKTTTLTYVVLPNRDDSDHHSLKELHLDLLKQAHEAESAYRLPNKAVRVNHVLLASSGQSENGSEQVEFIASDVASLVHYLTSEPTASLQFQTFYF